MTTQMLDLLEASFPMTIKCYLLVYMRNFDIFSMTSTLVQKLVCKLLNKCSCQSQNWQSRNFVPLYGSTEKIRRSTCVRLVSDWSDNLPQKIVQLGNKSCIIRNLPCKTCMSVKSLFYIQFLTIRYHNIPPSSCMYYLSNRRDVLTFSISRLFSQNYTRGMNINRSTYYK